MERGSAILVGAVAGAIGGILGAVATGWMRPAPTPAKPASADYAARAEEVRELQARVAALDAELTRLRQQRPAAHVPAPSASQKPAEGGRALPDDPVFEAAVRDVLDRVQQERAGEREERRAQGAQRWADQLAEKAHLTDAQKASVLGIAQDLLTRMREMRESAASPTGGGPPGQSWGEQRRALLAQGEQKLREVLSAKQMQVYEDSGDLRLDSILRGGRGRQ